MDFLVNHIWLVVIVLLVIWLIDRLMSRFTDRPAKGDHFQQQMDMNDKIRGMESGNFTDEDLKILLPGQRMLAVRLVQDKYGLDLQEAEAYVDKLLPRQKDESNAEVDGQD